MNSIGTNLITLWHSVKTELAPVCLTINPSPAMKKMHLKMLFAEVLCCM